MIYFLKYLLLGDYLWNQHSSNISSPLNCQCQKIVSLALRRLISPLLVLLFHRLRLTRNNLWALIPLPMLSSTSILEKVLGRYFDFSSTLCLQYDGDQSVSLFSMPNVKFLSNNKMQNWTKLNRLSFVSIQLSVNKRQNYDAMMFRYIINMVSYRRRYRRQK